MSKYRSERYKKIKDQTATEYSNPRWSAAKRWLARVGLVRLTAEAAAWEAAQLLRDINMSTHRNEPMIAEALGKARDAADEYVKLLTDSNWRRFGR